jgi:hypothetical protein
MKPNLFPRGRSEEAGSAMLFTMIMSSVALGILAGAMAWSATNTRLTDRSNRYTQCVAAAETATEKVMGLVSKDFVSGGQGYVVDNLQTYRSVVPTATDSSFWSDWEFSDACGNTGQTYVDVGAASNYVALGSSFASLKGFISICTLVSNARQPRAMQNVVGAVMQQLQLATIPIFQLAMYTSGDMEISCGQPFAVTGRVHSNGQLYVEPDNALTFLSSVTAVGDVLFQRAPLDTRGAPAGAVVYTIDPVPHVPALNLPIGMSNSPTAVREITQPPPAGEDPSSPLGRQRYYNEVDMLVVVSDTAVGATSGEFNGFSTVIPTNQWPLFVSTTNTFWDAREGKTVDSIDINVANLKAWSATNNNLRVALGSRDVSSLYVLDRRTLPGTALGAVRLVNGRQLPSRGLTVATSSPLYVLGHYNQSSDANLGTANTSTTLPASLVGDAITILSVNWTDPNSTAALASRMAGPTTVNAAILAGAVETTLGHYGGGMENFPRFLESWGLSNPFTYNGSMVKMFPSLYATNYWGTSNVYDPPMRNWAYDINFDDPTKLPPLTPGLQTVTRHLWATLAPNRTTVPASP